MHCGQIQGSKQVLGRGGNYSEEPADLKISSLTGKKNSMLTPSILLSTGLQGYKNLDINKEENGLF